MHGDPPTGLLMVYSKVYTPSIKLFAIAVLGPVGLIDGVLGPLTKDQVPTLLGFPDKLTLETTSQKV
jgi:hypothetical protein